MELYIRLSRSDLVKAAPAVKPCPHGGGVECLMRGGDGSESHPAAAPVHGEHEPPLAGHQVLARHAVTTGVSPGGFKTAPKPLEHPLPEHHALGLAKRVSDVTQRVVNRPDHFAELPPQHQNKIMDGLRAAHHVLERHYNQARESGKSWGELEPVHSYVRQARDQRADLQAHKEAQEKLAPLVEERKKYKAPVGHLESSSKKKGTSVTTSVDGSEVPLAHKQASEAVFHRLAGDHHFDDLHRAYSLEDPDYHIAMDELNIEHENPKYKRGGDSGSTQGKIHGRLIHKETGSKVGEFTRTLTRRPDGSLHVYHDFFKVHNDHQNQGAVNKVFRNSFKFYQDAGVNHVEVQPAWVGKYTWPRMGFHWGHGGNDEARRQLPMYLRDHFDMDHGTRHGITGEIAHKPWDVAKLRLPLPEKGAGGGHGDYGDFDYMGREPVKGEEGKYRYFYRNRRPYHYVDEDRPGTYKVGGSNAPVDHPDHDPKLGAPEINAGQDFLLSKHGYEIWNAAHHGHIRMHESDPGYQNICKYLKLDPKAAKAAPQERMDYHDPEPHKAPEREADEQSRSRMSAHERMWGSSSGSRSRGTCSNCGEETESRHDSYCPSCQEDKEKMEAKREREAEAKREKEEKLKRAQNKRDLVERDTLDPGGEVQPHHVLDATPRHRASGPYRRSPSKQGPGQEAAFQRRHDQDEHEVMAGPLSEPGVKINVRDPNPRFKGTWVRGKDHQWRPADNSERRMSWSDLHDLVQRGNVVRHDDRGSYSGGTDNPSQMTFGGHQLRSKGADTKRGILALQRWTRGRR